MRRWRDRKNKLVHAYDPTQNPTWQDVQTLCGVTVYITYQSPYGNTYTSLGHIPHPDKTTAELPKPSTKLTCMSCLALLW